MNATKISMNNIVRNAWQVAFVTEKQTVIDIRQEESGDTQRSLIADLFHANVLGVLTGTSLSLIDTEHCQDHTYANSTDLSLSSLGRVSAHSSTILDLRLRKWKVRKKK